MIVFLGWYDKEEQKIKEINEIQEVHRNEITACVLKYIVEVKRQSMKMNIVNDENSFEEKHS